MRIRFKTSIATDRASYVQGRIVTCESLPREWRSWLKEGVIEILPTDATETTQAPSLPEATIPPRSRSRKQETANG